MAPKTRLGVIGTSAQRAVIVSKKRFVPALNSMIARTVISKSINKIGIRKFYMRVINRANRAKVVRP